MSDVRSIFLGPADLAPPKVGTWTLELASNVPSLRKAAADETAILHVPISVPAAGEQYQGKQIESIEIFYKIGTAACDAVTFALYDLTLPAHGSAPSAAAVTVTQSVAAGDAKAAGNITQKLTISSPAILDGDSAYHLEVSLDAAATSVIDIYGVRINFT